MAVQSSRWIGSRTPRPDGVDKVTGRAAYGADFSAPGMIWGKVLRSPHPHARITSIDTSRAEALSGVKAAVTGADLVHFPFGTPAVLGVQDMRWMSRNVMAREKALFPGHPVAAVAATSEAVALRACELIDVRYEVLPWSIEIEDALKPDAPILHEELRSDGTPSNLVGRLEFGLGDVEEGFRSADVVVERTFTTLPVHQGYIETHACLVSVSPDGKATIWSSSQGQFMVRSMTAALVGMAQHDIRAIPAEIGGGFGGKTIIYLEPLATVLARKSGRPVKMVMTRDEVMRATGPTSGSVSTVKIGATRDGRLVAGQGTFHLQAGAFPGSPMLGAVGCPFSAYAFPHTRAVAFDVVSNRSKVVAYRAPGAPIGTFAVESVLDELADLLGVDPLEFRLRNAAHEGMKATHGQTFSRIGFRETLEAARSHPHYAAPLGRNQGRGVASGFWFNYGGTSSTQVNVTEDGNVAVTTGHPDVGGSRAAIVNICADLLGIDYRRVSVQIGDTSSMPFSSHTGGSRALFASSMAVTQAMDSVTADLCRRAAAIWKIEPEAVVWKDGAAHPASQNAGDFAPLTLRDLAGTAIKTGGPIGATVQMNATGAGPGFATHICDVDVDPELGTVRVLRYTAVQDVGCAIHPDYVEGQIQGAAAQGIGWALSEAYLYGEDGRVENPTFLDYRMPVCSDLPMLDTVLVEVANPQHPQGVRGVGETPLVPVLAAVANAVAHATGRRMYSLPMSPPKVLERLQEDTRAASLAH